MKYTLLFIMYIVSSGFAKASDTDSLVVWSEDYKLEWSDFRSDPDTSFYNIFGDKPKAVSNIVLSREYRRYDKSIYFNVNAFFNRNNSWTTTQDSSSLEHERVHFDISELYKRKIISALDSLKAQGCTDIKKYDQVFSKYAKLHRKRQDLFDQETLSGSLLIVQKVWQEEIYKELKDFKLSRNVTKCE